MRVTQADMPSPARTIDTSGRLCPFPIVEAAKAVKGLQSGAVLLVIATDPGAYDWPNRIFTLDVETGRQTQLPFTGGAPAAMNSAGQVAVTGQAESM